MTIEASMACLERKN